MNCFDDVVSAYRSSSMNLALADKILRMTLLACCYDGYASPCIRILYLYCNSKMDCWQDIAHQNGHRLRTIRIYIQLQLMSVVSREFRKLRTSTGNGRLFSAMALSLLSLECVYLQWSPPPKEWQPWRGSFVAEKVAIELVQPMDSSSIGRSERRKDPDGSFQAH